MTMEELKAMALCTAMNVNDRTFVMRVPGGWWFIKYPFEGQQTSVFVPEPTDTEMMQQQLKFWGDDIIENVHKYVEQRIDAVNERVTKALLGLGGIPRQSN